ncbi:putative hydrolase of the HAD superfamily [Streptacidiphilus sp. BW17]|uniref:HAD family hydrolase n=1 Tax=Streptacidiphilus sp. BW17 TaxID=3156274 RepID=UPI00351944CD
MTTAPRWALADYNGVIGRQAGADDWARLARVAGWHRDSLAPFQQLFWSLRPDYDRGLITADRFWARMGCPADRREEASAADTGMWMRADQQVVDLLRAARHRGMRLALLSNAPDGVARAIEQTPWANEFDVLRFSCDLHENKPHPYAYEATLTAMGVEPGERQHVLFIDDRLDNTQAARQLGMAVYHFTGDTTDFVRHLTQHDGTSTTCEAPAHSRSAPAASAVGAPVHGSRHLL